MKLVPLEQAEIEEPWGASIVTVPAGTAVRTSQHWWRMVTQEGLNCCCGKGVLCPLNPERKIL